VAARFAAARLMFQSGGRGSEFVSKDHINFYLKMERYQDEHC
jgi:hypothetical protein